MSFTEGAVHVRRASESNGSSSAVSRSACPSAPTVTEYNDFIARCASTSLAIAALSPEDAVHDASATASCEELAIAREELCDQIRCVRALQRHLAASRDGARAALCARDAAARESATSAVALRLARRDARLALDAGAGLLQGRATSVSVPLRANDAESDEESGTPLEEGGRPRSVETDESLDAVSSAADAVSSSEGEREEGEERERESPPVRTPAKRVPRGAAVTAAATSVTPAPAPPPLETHQFDATLRQLDAQQHLFLATAARHAIRRFSSLSKIAQHSRERSCRVSACGCGMNCACADASCAPPSWTRA